MDKKKKMMDDYEKIGELTELAFELHG